MDYYFVDDEGFDRMERDGELLEWAEVFRGHRYGTPAGPVELHRSAGRDVLLEIDVEGARQVRDRVPDAVLILLEPPSRAELERRLRSRGTESEADIAGMRMRPMARSLPTDTDVQAVAKHIAALPPQTPAPTIAGDAGSGAQQYLLCLACHGADAAGNEQMGAPPLTIPDDWYLLRQLQNLQQRVRGGNASRDATGAMMQPIASALSEQAMQDVIAYIQTLR